MKTKDRAERKKFALWANLAKEPACRGVKRQKLKKLKSWKVEGVDEVERLQYLAPLPG
jgi:hypothetical protein